MSKIRIKHEGKEYVLEFCRKSIETMEEMGFSIQNFSDKLMTSSSMLFHGAFLKNAPRISKKFTDEILDQMGNFDGLVETLVNMYIGTIEKLSGSDSKNQNWEVEN